MGSIGILQVDRVSQSMPMSEEVQLQGLCLLRLGQSFVSWKSSSLRLLCTETIYKQKNFGMTDHHMNMKTEHGHGERHIKRNVSNFYVFAL